MHTCCKQIMPDVNPCCLSMQQQISSMAHAISSLLMPSKQPVSFACGSIQTVAAATARRRWEWLLLADCKAMLTELLVAQGQPGCGTTYSSFSSLGPKKVKLLDALRAKQVLLVYTRPQPCLTAPVLLLAAAVGLSCGCCFR